MENRDFVENGHKLAKCAKRILVAGVKAPNIKTNPLLIKRWMQEYTSVPLVISNFFLL
jgi:hypothetical protein